MSVTQSQISEVMREMGRRGGIIGGKRRMESMDTNTLSEFQRAAVNARWAKYRAKKAQQKAERDPRFEELDARLAAHDDLMKRVTIAAKARKRYKGRSASTRTSHPDPQPTSIQQQKEEIK